MPGMMETILNVGLTRSNMTDWYDRLGGRTLFDSRRRLLQMMGETGLSIPKENFDLATDKVKSMCGCHEVSLFTEDSLAVLCDLYEDVYMSAGFSIPDTLEDQLRLCISAVFGSWEGPKAKAFREHHGITNATGTAVTIQSMVFGNCNENSGSGVLFTRNPSTGEDQILGEYLVNAQGEDVVAGIRTPDKLILAKGDSNLSGWKQDLFKMACSLEKYFGDMQDIEFTVQDGKVYLLQTRTGKRTATAAFRIAYDMYAEGFFGQDNPRKAYLARITEAQYFAMLRPTLDVLKADKPLFVGLPACTGVAIGRAYFSPAAVKSSKDPAILVRKETTPDDIDGMCAAAGILTHTGGVTSHAAVVARSMDKPCIVGASFHMDDYMQSVSYEGGSISAGDWITIDGGTGKVYAGQQPVINPSDNVYMKFFLDTLLEGVDNTSLYGENTHGSSVVSLASYLDFGGDVAAVQEKLDEVVDAIVEYSSTSKNRVILDISPWTTYSGTGDSLLWDLCGEGSIEKSWDIS